MQKLVLVLLPLVVVACVDRDRASARSSAPDEATAGALAADPIAPGANAQQRGRGEGERETNTSSGAPASSPGTSTTGGDATFPASPRTGGEVGGGGTVTLPGERSETSELDGDGDDRDAAGSSDLIINDGIKEGLIIDEGGATGFGGQTPTPESIGDGLPRAPRDPRDALRDRNTINENELDMMPADVVDAGPGMIP